MANLDQIMDYLAGQDAETQVSLTRVNNSYVDSTSFGRLSVERIGKFGIFHINLQPTTSIPSGQSSFTQIGTMTPAPAVVVRATIPSQLNNSTISFEINTSGDISILNGSGTATGTSGSWFRANIPFFFN